MGLVTRGPLILLGLGLLICILAGLSTAQVTDAYLGDKDGNRNDTVLLGGPLVTFVALVQGDVVEFDISTNSTLVDPSWSSGGSDRIDGGRRLYEGFPLLSSTSPGDHEFTFVLDYTLSTNESHRVVFNLTAHLVQAIELVDVHITSGAPRRLVLEVRIYIPCESIAIEYDSDGRIQTAKDHETLENLEPGVYTFNTRLERALGTSGYDDDEVGYRITAVFRNQTIELIRKNIDPNELMRDDGSSPVLIIVIMFVLVLTVLLVIIFRMRRRPRTLRAQPVAEPRFNPPA